MKGLPAFGISDSEQHCSSGFAIPGSDTRGTVNTPIGLGFLQVTTDSLSAENTFLVQKLTKRTSCTCLPEFGKGAFSPEVLKNYLAYPFVVGGICIFGVDDKPVLQLFPRLSGRNFFRGGVNNRLPRFNGVCFGIKTHHFSIYFKKHPVTLGRSRDGTRVFNGKAEYPASLFFCLQVDFRGLQIK